MLRARCTTLAACFRDPVQRTRGSVGVDVMHRLPMGSYRQCRWGPKDFPDDWRASSEEAARELVTRWARVMLFMDRTGLRPSVAWRNLFGRKHPQPLPGLDHALVWLDDESHYLVTAEPKNATQRGRLKWAAQEDDWTFAEVDSFGLWRDAPGHLCVLAPPKRGGKVEAVCQALEMKLKRTERYEYWAMRKAYEVPLME